ncbi:Hypothetical predicted protein [Pelobates cultripes]|uniref:Uncharacterized protein n=1 Tax=Pelobates cultripes TaxID=61616 RepID=A0AAD1R3B4_PELCU|nr:Hypothetical predicted protein [Pelobates cultripes]
MGTGEYLLRPHIEYRARSWDDPSYGGEARGTPCQRKQHYKRPTEVSTCNLLTKHAQIYHPQNETPLRRPSLTCHISQTTAWGPTSIDRLPAAAVLHSKVSKAIGICILPVADTRLKRKSNTWGLLV